MDDRQIREKKTTILSPVMKRYNYLSSQHTTHLFMHLRNYCVTLVVTRVYVLKFNSATDS